MSIWYVNLTEMLNRQKITAKNLPISAVIYKYYDNYRYYSNYFAMVSKPVGVVKTFTTPTAVLLRAYFLRFFIPCGTLGW